LKHAWLAIDPGITTGWALLSDTGEVMGTSVWGTAELRKSLDLVVRLAHTSGYSLTVVIERMPSTGKMGALGQKLEAVRRDIASIVEETYELRTMYIMPGEWKPSRIARTAEVPRKFDGSPLMTHQKDAIRMGRYAQSKEEHA
jgi:hypothetical protein